MKSKKILKTLQKLFFKLICISVENFESLEYSNLTAEKVKDFFLYIGETNFRSSV